MPAGSFTMGSPASEQGRDSDEGPQHKVTVASFAVGKFEVTFAEWEACVAGGGCASNESPSDAGWGKFADMRLLQSSVFGSFYPPEFS